MKKAVILSFILLLLSNGLAIAGYLAVKVPIANIRSGPSEKHDILWKVETYHPFRIIKKSGNWYQFQDFEGDQGWIHNSLVQKIPSAITKRDKCNVRSGPGTQHNILFTTEKGIPFKILNRKGKWIHIQHVDGDKGWIHVNLIWPNG
ncbi:MAG: SH3 domain-containing protein [Deltaproteobacteria bacterium]|nr:SH3 domain-containing protein [Deltaproteobacteria bacterium]